MLSIIINKCNYMFLKLILNSVLKNTCYIPKCNMKAQNQYNYNLKTRINYIVSTLKK